MGARQWGGTASRFAGLPLPAIVATGAMCTLALACAPPQELERGGVGALTSAFGEPAAGFPNWFERMVWVLTNRVRSDPATDLADCANCAEKACYSPMAPVEWAEGLNHAARFHADNLVATGCTMSHTSPCTLVEDIGSLYPDSCDGAQACACAGAKSCGSGTSMGTRVSRFHPPGFKAENLAGGSDPFSVFYAWMHEPTGDSSCGLHAGSPPFNGHRWAIMGNYTHLGVGWNGTYTVEDFWNDGNNFGPPAQPLVAGAHYPETGSNIAFRANWYHDAGPASATVNVDGTCHTMTVERGTASNGTYLADIATGSGCVSYYFRFADASGTVVTWPTSGSYGVNCPTDWSATRPTAGTGCAVCVPDCSGRQCGDDGCGGSCGDCGPDQSCDMGACVCPDVCEGDARQPGGGDSTISNGDAVGDGDDVRTSEDADLEPLVTGCRAASSRSGIAFSVLAVAALRWRKKRGRGGEIDQAVSWSWLGVLWGRSTRRFLGLGWGRSTRRFLGLG